MIYALWVAFAAWGAAPESEFVPVSREVLCNSILTIFAKQAPPLQEGTQELQKVHALLLDRLVAFTPVAGTTVKPSVEISYLSGNWRRWAATPFASEGMPVWKTNSSYAEVRDRFFEILESMAQKLSQPESLDLQVRQIRGKKAIRELAQELRATLQNLAWTPQTRGPVAEPIYSAMNVSDPKREDWAMVLLLAAGGAPSAALLSTGLLGTSPTYVNYVFGASLLTALLAFVSAGVVIQDRPVLRTKPPFDTEWKLNDFLKLLETTSGESPCYYLGLDLADGAKLDLCLHPVEALCILRKPLTK